MSFNTYDNPTITGFSRVLLIYNAVGPTDSANHTCNLHVEYNYINANSEKIAIASNHASNAPPGVTPYLAISNYIRRNTIVGGAIFEAQNYDTAYGVNRRTFLANNSISTTVPTVSTVSGVPNLQPQDWFSSVGNLSGAFIDPIGKPTDPQSIGKVGAIIYKP